MNFPEKLYSLRKSKNFSQDELAEKLGVSRQAVSRWEMGTAEPSAQNLIELSNLFGVSIDYLLKDEAPPEAKEKEREGENRESAPSPIKAKRKCEGLFVVSVGLIVCHAIGILNVLPLSFFVVSIPFATVLWGIFCVFHFINILIFELVYRHFKSIEGAKAHKRRYYRISVWFFSLAPAMFVTCLLAMLGIVPFGTIAIGLLLYLPVCIALTLILKEKKQNKGNLNKENS